VSYRRDNLSYQDSLSPPGLSAIKEISPLV
jgi:hypothetical protein